MRTATTFIAAVLLLAALPSNAVSQTLGDEFIFFVNGSNVMVPTIDAVPVDDPLDPGSGNKVARINSGAWTHAGWSWGRNEGIDATANVGDVYGESDTLFFRINSDPANAGLGGISIMLSDKTDDSPANDGSADLEFRLIWPIPQWIHDGQWHDLAIPLPPKTRAALEDAKAGVDIDTLAAKWEYPGSWSAGGFGVGPGFGTGTDDPLWKEFEWDALYRIGPFWDNGTGGGPIYLDDVYIGGSGTDLSVAVDPPSPMSGVAFATDGSENVISWSENAEFAGYNVYGSLEPFSDLSDPGVIRLATLSMDDGTEFRHRYEVPHPSFGAAPIYYAVTGMSAFGVENDDISQSSGEVQNDNLPQKAYILEISEEAATAMFLAISDGTVTDEHFAENHPVFIVDSSHRSPGDGTTVETMPSDDDNSGLFKIGYTQLNEWFIYGEITDDTVTFASMGQTGADTWNYDSAEIVFGHYDVREVGGGVFVGSPHQDMQRGEEPDYGIRITALQEPSGDIGRTSTWVGWSIDVDFESATAVEKTDTGWRFLTLLPMDQIQNTEQGDVLLQVPASDELQLIPFIISLNDADGATRQTQIVWSIKPNVTTQWWNTPAQWETVAIAGMNYTGTAIDGPDVPTGAGFALEQNVPNPAFGRAEIGFTLATPQRATIEVFNMLGQRVSVLADREMAPGRHTVSLDTSRLPAGVYLYRLRAGEFTASKRLTVVH